MSKITNGEIIAYFDDVGEVEVGEFLKHDYCSAQRTLDVTQTDVDECPALAPYLGLLLVQQGISSYNDGYETFDDEIKIYRKVEKQTKMSADFWDLMSHLNSEDNDKAFEFSQKYLPDAKTLEEVKNVD
ncbi:hypothetical protein [Dickeya phage Mysterion]|uniref:Uncharacterized protein n=1 Tax=Dickeya phage Mysterion TaxID=2320193 RepID=A0A385IGU2_9CAUD|nr:hypothetical protein HOU15_gp31 [Dickeya phage Mysterion]AXY81964.1 hypothetical protein [Dickeya phage Mysterion]